MHAARCCALARRATDGGMLRSRCRLSAGGGPAAAAASARKHTRTRVSASGRQRSARQPRRQPPPPAQHAVRSRPRGSLHCGVSPSPASPPLPALRCFRLPRGRERGAPPPPLRRPRRLLTDSPEEARLVILLRRALCERLLGRVQALDALAVVARALHRLRRHAHLTRQRSRAHTQAGQGRAGAGEAAEKTSAQQFACSAVAVALTARVPGCRCFALLCSALLCSSPPSGPVAADLVVHGGARVLQTHFLRLLVVALHHVEEVRVQTLVHARVLHCMRAAHASAANSNTHRQQRSGKAP